MNLPGKLSVVATSTVRAYRSSRRAPPIPAAARAARWAIWRRRHLRTRPALPIDGALLSTSTAVAGAPSVGRRPSASVGTNTAPRSCGRRHRASRTGSEAVSDGASCHVTAAGLGLKMQLGRISHTTMGQLARLAARRKEGRQVQHRAADRVGSEVGRGVPAPCAASPWTGRTAAAGSRRVAPAAGLA